MNCEYNVLFPNLPPGKMRHGDHRFEWTRSEFSEWAQAIGARFAYEVRIKPVGLVSEDHGAPSQMAVFSLNSKASER